MKAKPAAPLILALLLSCGGCAEGGGTTSGGSLRANSAVKITGVSADVPKSTAQALRMRLPDLRTEYDFCMLNEFRALPVTAHEVVALTCYIDCLRAKATFAPRMCQRMCVNALERHGIGSLEICPRVCPEACRAVAISDQLCLPE
eukprot:CAMPEP_0179047734 /NCGR_PEP_ID=MMETSP0796-20121207/19348_1 /TAXON_ID=73915 /ORGANISM="Pyrodinium bahamense, Strain pbaha01" /LENGTH=145 /DNA_ID=CAMNT_0020744185 /DNA_START=103 /DNA_END=540 /DNA_ORIENTATION=+